MSKRKVATDLAELQPEEAQPPLRPAWRAILSLLLALHVTAVFMGPFAFASSVAGGSPFVQGVHRLLRPYIGAMFLEHGYFFFAPNPGPTHSVRYRVEFDDGREPVEGVFPNLAEHRPRLLYHRHFMLAEELHNRFTDPQPPAEPVPPPLTAAADDRARYQAARQAHAEVVQVWNHRRRVYQAMRESMEQHLLEKHGGARVTLTRLERRPLDPAEVRELGKRIDDPDTLRALPETSWLGDER